MLAVKTKKKMPAYDRHPKSYQLYLTAYSTIIFPVILPPRAYAVMR